MPPLGPVLCNVLFSSGQGEETSGDQLPGAEQLIIMVVTQDTGDTQHIQTTVYWGDGLLMIPCVLPSAPLRVLSFVIVWTERYISCEVIGPVLFDQFHPKVYRG